MPVFNSIGEDSQRGLATELVDRVICVTNKIKEKADEREPSKFGSTLEGVKSCLATKAEFRGIPTIFHDITKQKDKITKK